MIPQILFDLLKLTANQPLLIGLILCALILISPSFEGRPYLPPLTEEEEQQRLACG